MRPMIFFAKFYSDNKNSTLYFDNGINKFDNKTF